jgi:hypothetical protein
MSNRSSSSCGIGFGSVVAAVISWALNHSFWWCVFHLILGWVYVLYAVFFRTKEIVPAVKAMFL